MFGSARLDILSTKISQGTSTELENNNLPLDSYRQGVKSALPKTTYL